MNDAVPAAEKISPGQALAAARAELKLSPADVSQQIKYSVKQITAIEAGDYEKLPGTTFVRGMIRSYAKLVQIDPEPLLVDLGQHENPAAAAANLHVSGREPFIEGGTKSNRVYILLSFAAFVAVAVVAYEWWSNPLDAGQVVTIMPRSGQGDADAGIVAAPMPASVPAPAAAEQASAAAPVEQSSAQAAELQPQPESAAAPQEASPGALKRIELAFDQLSWVEIKQSDGKILMSKLNQPGTTQVVEGVPPFDVIIGNAASTHLKYDDAPVDLRPFFKVDVARLKLE